MVKYRNVVQAFSTLARDAFGFVSLESEASSVVALDKNAITLITLGEGVVRYRVLLSDRESVIHVSVRLEVSGETLTVDLKKLAAAAGVAKPNKIPSGARTIHELDRALNAQAEVARTLHPLLIGTEGAALFAKAGARRLPRQG